jgi:hypothetical protein
MWHVRMNMVIDPLLHYTTAIQLSNELKEAAEECRTRNTQGV